MSLEVLNDASDTQLIIKTGGYSVLLSLSRYLIFSLISTIPRHKTILSEVILSGQCIPDIIILKDGDYLISQHT